jgi:hypothetical protein
VEFFLRNLGETIQLLKEINYIGPLYSWEASKFQRPAKQIVGWS